MDAMVNHFLHILEAEPYQAWLFPITLITLSIYLLIRWINHRETHKRNRAADILELLSSPACPERMRPLLHDYLEAKAFSLATYAAPRTRQAREDIFHFYLKHRGSLDVTDIGYADDYLAFRNGQWHYTSFFFFTKFMGWFSWAISGICIFFLAILFIYNDVQAPSVATTILAIEAFALWATGLFTHWELSQASQVLAIQNIPISSAHDPEALSDS